MNNSPGDKPMSSLSRHIQIRYDGDVMVIVPDGDLGEFVVSQIAEDAEAAINRLQTETAWCHIVIDLCQTDYFGSSALGLFVRLWKRVREHGGRMAMCNLSQHEKELLQITRLNEFWLLCDSLEDALSAVRGGDTE